MIGRDEEKDYEQPTPFMWNRDKNEEKKKEDYMIQKEIVKKCDQRKQAKK